MRSSNKTLLYRSSWRYYLKRPLHLFFSVFGVALGVALVVGIDMASQSARQGFSLSIQSIAGAASHQIISAEHVVPESLYTQLRNELGLRSATPLIKQTVQFNILSDEVATGVQQQDHSVQVDVQLIGIDPFSETEIRPWQQGMIESIQGDGLQRLLTDQNGILVEDNFLNEHDLQIGDQISLSITDIEYRPAHQFEIIGSFTAPEVYQAQLKNWLISDISTVQEILNFNDGISQIDLLLDTQSESKVEQIKQLLPEGVQLVKVNEQAQALARLSESFELNLTALSLLGLLVAMFLIYNTMMFSVVQRRGLLARMRILGVSRQELFRLILTEALLIGILSTGAGLLMGIGLAHILLYFVTRTINDLYYVIQVTQLHWSYLIVFKAFFLGVGATILSALVPALEAAYTRPVMALQRYNLERKINRWSRWFIIPGCFSGLLVYFLLNLQVEDQMNDMFVGFSSVFISIAAFIFLLPFFSHYLLILLAFVMKRIFKLSGKIAVNNIIRSFSRSIVAIAALAVSVSSALGIGIMVESFRFTVDDWLLGYLKADYFIGSENDSRSSQVKGLVEPFDKKLLSDLSHLPGIDFISSDQEVRFFIEGQYHYLTVLDIPLKSFSAFHLKEGHTVSAQKAWLDEDAVIISEPYAYRHKLSVNDTIYLPVSKDSSSLGKTSLKKAFKVVGIYYHYGSEQGVITMNRATYNRHWNTRKLNALGLYLSSDVLHDQVQRKQFETQLKTLISGKSLHFVSKEDLHKKSLIIFDRTFKITNVLKLLVIFVSFVGILTALMAIELERGREFSILRATGLTGKQLSNLVYIETITMGIVAALLAMPMGILLAYLLIEVINYRSFGWSMQFILPWTEFFIAGSLAILASVLAAIYPAWHLSRTQPALALRGE
ncbi:MAG: FtsX-like permease family protein [Gammaproteobacteria bacterium]|nr:FtsX-like permease family protein [Gammaproteobacteria bacterium]